MKRLLFAALALVFCAASAIAQQVPVTCLLSYPAGGLTDQFTRALAKSFQESTGRETRVENVVGYGPEVGAAQSANRANDGSVVFVHNWYFTSAQAAALLPLAEVGYAALGIWRSPLTSNLTNVGFGGDRASYVYTYISQNTLKSLAGGRFDPIPYKSTAAAINDTARLGGWFVGDLVHNDAARRAGLQMVGTTAPSETRKLGWPDLPNQNKNMLDSEFGYTIGVYVPPGTLQVVQDDLRAKLASTVASGAFVDRARGIGVVADYRERTAERAGSRPAWVLSLMGSAAIRNGAPIDPPAAVYALSTSGSPGNVGASSDPVRDDPKTTGRGARGG